MPVFQENVSLKPYNSFGVEAKATHFTVVETVDEIQAVRSSSIFKNNDVLVLGGGSNVLFTRDFEGLVILNRLRGLEISSTSDTHVVVEVAAGEVWQDVVVKCVDKGWGGIENLSLIPGRIGAAPIQNIGAYGTEIKDVFVELIALDLMDGSLKKFTARECEFGYRDSIFKRQMKGRYAILSVSMRLSLQPELQLDYGAIHQTLKKMNVRNPDVKSVSEAVCKIRRSKLPDPQKIGNAGSFFKNPVISSSAFQSLKKQWSDVPGYNQPGDKIKLPAGWLIEKSGWKGRSLGAAGVHKKQALVLVNSGNATGAQIRDLAFQVKADVQKLFGILLETEVNII